MSMPTKEDIPRSVPEIAPAQVPDTSPQEVFSSEVLASPSLAEAVETVRDQGDVLDALRRNRLLNATSITSASGVTGVVGGVAETTFYHETFVGVAQPTLTYAGAAFAASLMARGALWWRKAVVGGRALAVQDQARDALGQPVELFRVKSDVSEGQNRPQETEYDVLMRWLPGDTKDEHALGERLKRLAKQADQAGVDGLVIESRHIPERLRAQTEEDKPPLTLSSLLLEGKGANRAIHQRGEEENPVLRLSIDEALSLAEQLMPPERKDIWDDVQQALRVCQKPELAKQIEHFVKDPTNPRLKRQLKQTIGRLLESQQNEVVVTTRSAAELASNPGDANLHKHRTVSARLAPNGRQMHRVGSDGVTESTALLRKVFDIERVDLQAALAAKGRNISLTKLLNTALVEVWEELHDLDPAELRKRPPVQFEDRPHDDALLQPTIAGAYRWYIPKRRLKREGLARPSRGTLARKVAAAALSGAIAGGPAFATNELSRQLYYNRNHQIEQEVIGKYQDVSNSFALPEEGREELHARRQQDPIVGTVRWLENVRLDITSLEDELFIATGLMPSMEEYEQKRTEAEARQEVTGETTANVDNAGTNQNQPVWQLDSFNGADSAGYWLQNSMGRLGNSGGNGIFAWAPLLLERESFKPVPLQSPESVEQSGQPYIMASTPSIEPSIPLTLLPNLYGYKIAAAQMIDQENGEAIPFTLSTAANGEYLIEAADSYSYFWDSRLTLWLTPDATAGFHPSEQTLSQILDYGESEGVDVPKILREVLAQRDPELLKVANIQEAAAHIANKFQYGVNPLAEDDIRQITDMQQKADKLAAYINTMYDKGRLNCNLATTLLAIVNEARGFTEPLSIVRGYLNSNDPADKIHQYLSTNETHLLAMGVVKGADGSEQTVIIDPTPGGGISAEDQLHFQEKYEQDGKAPDLYNENTPADRRLKLSAALAGALLLSAAGYRRRRAVFQAFRDTEEWGFKMLDDDDPGRHLDVAAGRSALDTLWSPDGKAPVREQDRRKYAGQSAKQMAELLPDNTSLRGAIRIARGLPVGRRQRIAARKLLRLATYEARHRAESTPRKR